MCSKVGLIILVCDLWNSRKGDNLLGFLLIKFWDVLCFVGYLFVFFMFDGINCEVCKNIGFYFLFIFFVIIIVIFFYV